MRCASVRYSSYAGSKQNGAALILLTLILSLTTTIYILKSANSFALHAEKNKKTMAALAEAKRALLAYAATQDLTCVSGTNNCPRPGDLPCPDTNNDGSAQSSCGTANGTTGQSERIGRLPWKTLGTGDLRDGDGERLWYAVSNRYKNNSRYRPLNTDTTGTITLRDSIGAVINDASSTTGLVSIVFSPGSAITRQDGVVQERGAGQENNPVNYLDTAYGEDNAAFMDGSLDGFVTGSIKDVNGAEIVNDRLLVITQEDMHSSMESRVLLESAHAMLDYFCGFGNADYENKACITAVAGSRFYPSPASFSDVTCLGNNTILSVVLPISGITVCTSSNLITHGRIPVNIANSSIIPLSPQWASNSIFRGESQGNWFQLNAWRELIHYAVAPACKEITPNCAGTGFLILNNALIAPDNTKKVILIASGVALSGFGQQREINTNKTLESNYLEDQNLMPLDDTYSRLQPFNNIRNDRAISIP